jgi:hypothetical protein
MMRSWAQVIRIKIAHVARLDLVRLGVAEVNLPRRTLF